MVDSAAFEKIDELHSTGDAQFAYDEIKRIYDSDASNRGNVEVLWRLARACHSLSGNLDAKNPKKKELIVDGQKYAATAASLDEANFNAVKWAAVLTGALTDFLGTKEKIQEGYVFKSYLDKGLAMNASEYSLLHMRGRFAFSVASLSWLERKAAATFFAEPPSASFDDAIADFLEVEKLKPGEWLENLLYLSKSYVAKGDKPSAVKYLQLADALEAADEVEYKKEVKALLQKHSR